MGVARGPIDVPVGADVIVAIVTCVLAVESPSVSVLIAVAIHETAFGGRELQH